MLPFSFILAFRFLKSSHQEKNIATMVKICFLSILIGTTALTLVAAIMNGFEKATHKKLQGIHADITINAYDKAIDYDKLKKVLVKEYSDTLEAFSPLALTQIIVQNRSVEPHETQIALLKVVDPEEEPKTSAFASMIQKEDSIADTHKQANVTGFQNSVSYTSTIRLWDIIAARKLVMGASLAERLRIKQGDTITVLYPQEEIVSNKVCLDEKEFTVGMLFKTGIHDFDDQVVIGSFDLINELYPVKVNQVSLKLKNKNDEKSVTQALKKRFNLEVFSWKDLYPPLVSALTLEKYALCFILALISLVASLNIISLLFMYATQKQQDIALLKTMGMRNGDLIVTFVCISLMITLTATALGILLAALATWFLKTYPFITLPDVYYVTHLPAELDMTIIISVLLLAFFVSLFAALLPAQKIKSMNMAHVLKGLPI